MNQLQEAIPAKKEGAVEERVDNKGRRWIQDHESVYIKAVEKYGAESLSPNKETILSYLRDMQTGDSSKRLKAKKKVSKSRCLKMMGILKNVDHWLGYKVFMDVTLDDMKDMDIKLSDDIIVPGLGKKPYTDTTKAGFRKVIRKFWRWLKGSNREIPIEVEFMDTFEPTGTIQVYSIEEIMFLRDNILEFDKRALLMIMFDLGCRSNELLNLKISDVIVPNGEDNFYYVVIRDSIAKCGRGRIIPLTYANPWLQKYLQLYHKDPHNKDAFLFDIGYHELRMFLQRQGLKILGKSVTPHRLRASSATYFASPIGDYFDWIYKYGWSLHSSDAERYYNRGFVNAKNIARSCMRFEREKAQDECRVITGQNVAMKERLQTYEKEMQDMKRYNQVLNHLLDKPAVLKIATRYMSEADSTMKLINERKQTGVISE